MANVKRIGRGAAVIAIDARATRGHVREASGRAGTDPVHDAMLHLCGASGVLNDARGTTRGMSPDACTGVYLLVRRARELVNTVTTPANEGPLIDGKRHFGALTEAAAEILMLGSRRELSSEEGLSHATCKVVAGLIDDAYGLLDRFGAALKPNPEAARSVGR